LRRCRLETVQLLGRRRPVTGRVEAMMCLAMSGGGWRRLFFMGVILRDVLVGLIGMSGNIGTHDRIGVGPLKRKDCGRMLDFGASHDVFGKLLANYLIAQGKATMKATLKQRAKATAAGPGSYLGRDRHRGCISRTSWSSERKNKEGTPTTWLHHRPVRKRRMRMRRG
jgi:hypothetical protein